MLERIPRWLWVTLVILASLPVKIAAAHQMPFDIDIVPVVGRNVEYLLTPVGTLSSVAAYNMPMLEWLHLPAQWLTGHVWWTILLTLVAFNILSMLAVYGLASDLFGFRAGITALVLFGFSEVGISSAYTAWAQLLLPGFFAMTVYCLWQWRTRERGRWLALAGIVATAAFMTHFAAVLLYPAMLAFALVTGARWQWRGLSLGTAVVALMLAPYLLFQIERDFVDLRAFLTQDVLVDAETMAQVEVYKPGYTALNIMPDNARPQMRPVDEPPPRWQRALAYAAETPFLTLKGLNAAFDVHMRALENAFPALTALWVTIGRVAQVTFWGMLIVSAGATVRAWRQSGVPRNLSAWQRALTDTQTGRIWLLMGLVLVMIAVLLLTRTIDNDTYLMGFIALQLIVAAALTTYLPQTRRTTLMIVALLIVVAGTQSADRILRLSQHDDTVFSPLNTGLYRHMEAATDHIAAVWQSTETPVIQYDFITETPYFWWVPAWHTIDPSYRLGMGYDFLLDYHHGIINANDDPFGFADNPDFIVVYTPGLARYDLSLYTVNTFGIVNVLHAP